MPARSGSGRSPSGPGSTAWRISTSACVAIERRAAEHARVEVALARADGEVEVADAPQRRADRRQRLRRVAAVEDECHVGRAGVLLDPVDDRVPADLLLGVDREADVDRELAGRREELGRAEKHEHVRLVVRHAAGDERSRSAPRAPRDRYSQSSSGSGGCTSRWAYTSTRRRVARRRGRPRR